MDVKFQERRATKEGWREMEMEMEIGMGMKGSSGGF